MVSGLNMNSAIMKLLKFFLSGYFVFTLTFTMCTPDSAKESVENTVKPGAVAPDVKCISDTAFSYALYIPSTYNDKKNWPVLICFDPHAEGLIPVNLFYRQAEKSGYIVAGSNTSRNGMSMDQTNKICSSLISDLKNRFQIDDKSIYLVGFSGGSRVAGSYAQNFGNIAGVVGIGAGLNGAPVNFNKPFSYLAMAGTFDFNYVEMSNMIKSMEQTGFVHHFIEFDGPHGWPPVELIPDVMTWIEFDRMRNGSVPKDRNQINAFIENKYAQYNKQRNSGKYYEAYNQLLMLKNYLNGLNEVSPIEEEIAQLLGVPELKRTIEIRESVLLQESQLQSTFSRQLQMESLDFWKKKIKEIRMASEKIPVDDFVRMQKRVLGFLSLSAYSLSNRGLQQNNYNEAGRYIELYRIIDPENCEHRYMAAQLNMKMNKKEDALIELQNAVKLGFKDKKRLQNDPIFTTLHSEPAFELLTQ